SKTVDSVLTFPSGYDTLEYSWVKATAVSVHLRILFVTLQSTNKLSGAVADHSEPRREESTLSHESLSTPESEPSSSTSQYSSVEPSPEPRTPKEEEIQPSEFSSRFEDDPSGNIKNTSNHLRHEEPI